MLFFLKAYQINSWKCYLPPIGRAVCPGTPVYARTSSGKLEWLCLCLCLFNPSCENKANFLADIANVTTNNKSVTDFIEK